jgi:predicted lipid-binding transport protein (Tim44 family)
VISPHHVAAVHDAVLHRAVLSRAGGGQGFGGGGDDLGGGGLGGGSSFPLFFFGGGALAEGGSILTVVVVVGAILLGVMWVSRNRRRPALDGGPPLHATGSKGIVEHPYAHSDAPAYTPGTVPVVESGRPIAPPPPPAGAQAGLKAIETHDPAFNLDGFKSSVERCFFVVEEGWTELKPEMTRRVMADGIWQQHRAQIEQYRQAGTRNVLSGLAVGKVTIRSASSDQQYDTITARILATCADYDVDVKTNKVVRGDQHAMTPFQEDWVFQRSSQAVTPAGGGTLEEKCPNCGAPLDVDLAGVCHYCRASIMSGQFDWVLTRIDQV